MNTNIKKLVPYAAVILILAVTTGLYLYTSGYRFSKPKKDTPVTLTKTGMISAKSIPDGATVYINGNLTTATNDTVSGITPGKYTLKIAKKGFVEWSKELEVYNELVTDITAVLISESPRLEPLTNTGAFFPAVSPTLSKLAYFSKDAEKPGLWVIPLSQTGLSLFKVNPYLVIQDKVGLVYSTGKNIEWSPDEKEIMVQLESGATYVIDLQNNSAKLSLSPQTVKDNWNKNLVTKRSDFIEKLDIPQNIKDLAITDKAMWSPDEKKFMYTRTNGDKLEYIVYNMEKPIPVGEKVENIVFTTIAKDVQPKLSWYQDSFHLIMVEAYEAMNKKGTVSMIRIDGSNKTEVYNNTLMSDKVFSAPAGDKLIILTSFKSNGQSNLYTLGIR